MWLCDLAGPGGEYDKEEDDKGEDEDEDEDDPFELAYPRPEKRTTLNLFWFFLTFPIYLSLKYTVVDVRKPG